jgi:hypothetical protein
VPAARVVAEGERLLGRHPARDVALGQPLVRDEPQPAPRLGDRELGVERVGRVPVAEQFRARLGRPGHGDRLERPVGVDVVDDGDLEAEPLDDAVDDGLQGRGKAAPAVDPADQAV